MEVWQETRKDGRDVLLNSHKAIVIALCSVRWYRVVLEAIRGTRMMDLSIFSSLLPYILYGPTCKL